MNKTKKAAETDMNKTKKAAEAGCWGLGCAALLAIFALVLWLGPMSLHYIAMVG